MPPIAPKSPLTLLGEALQATSVLKGYAEVKVGVKYLAEQSRPPRIIIFPISGTYESAADNKSALRDIEQELAARIWGSDLDQAWELQQRYFQALEEQGQGSDNGIYWKAIKVSWDAVPDMDKQGVELESVISVRLALDRVPVRIGEVDAVNLIRE